MAPALRDLRGWTVKWGEGSGGFGMTPGGFPQRGLYRCLRGHFCTARAQRGHSANYYGDYPGNNPENHAPAESCTINSKLKNSNI